MVSSLLCLNFKCNLLYKVNYTPLGGLSEPILLSPPFIHKEVIHEATVHSRQPPQSQPDFLSFRLCIGQGAPAAKHEQERYLRQLHLQRKRPPRWEKCEWNGHYLCTSWQKCGTLDTGQQQSALLLWCGWQPRNCGI